jgi:hypothetical protein
VRVTQHGLVVDVQQPGSKALAASMSARPVERDITAAAKPYSVRLASSAASSSVAKLVMDATGPKTSSSKARMPGLTLPSTVGR